MVRFRVMSLERSIVSFSFIKSLMRYIKILAKFAISLVLIWLVFRSINLTGVLKDLSLVKIPVMLGAILVFFLQIVVLALRWTIVTGILGRRLTSTTAIRITFISQFLNQVLPSTVGGDAVRIYLGFKEGGSLKQSFQGVITDRAIATAMLFALVLIAFPMQAAIIGSPATRWIADIFSLGAFLGFVVFLLLAEPLHVYFGRFRIAREVADIGLSIRKVLMDRKHSLHVLFLSLVNHLMSIFGMMLLAWALRLDVAGATFFVLVPFVLLLSMIPISIGGWGLREGIMIAAFGYVGMSNEQSVSLSLLFGVTITLVSLPGGVFWLFQKDHHIIGRKIPRGA